MQAFGFNCAESAKSASGGLFAFGRFDFLWPVAVVSGGLVLWSLFSLAFDLSLQAHQPLNLSRQASEQK